MVQLPSEFFFFNALEARQSCLKYVVKIHFMSAEHMLVGGVMY